MINSLNTFFFKKKFDKNIASGADEIQNLAMKHAGTATLLSLGTGNKAGDRDLWVGY